LTPGSGNADAVPGLTGVFFVLGKGGVGKSVVAAGLAALAAKKGRRTLLVRIGESLEAEEAGSSSPVRSRLGFEELELDPKAAMDEFIQHVVRIRPLVERVTRSEVYKKFFAAAPGLPELVLLGRIRAYFAEADGKGALRYETIIVDCPSTGHALLMLETPFAAFRAVPVGPFARLAAQIIEWLKNEVRIAVVAMPEEMAVVEAVEFKEDLQERTGLEPKLAFMNRMRLETLSPAAHTALLEVEAPEGSEDRFLLDCARESLRRARLETFHRRRLARGLEIEPMLIRELPSARPSIVAEALAEEFA
jgi:anion-transporting  ArsA/GET3 family ATPase